MNKRVDRDGDIPQVLGAGNHLQLLSDHGWEYAQRIRGTGVVAIIAVTEEGELVLTEQFRPAVKGNVIDLPAGLAGDLVGEEDEALLTAAKRELLEETGFESDHWTELPECFTSPGMTDESVRLFCAESAYRVTAGGGDESEQITVHLVPLSDVARWLAVQTDQKIDVKVYAGLHFARS